MLNHRLSLEVIASTPPFVPLIVKFRATGTLATESLSPTALGIPTGVEALAPTALGIPTGVEALGPELGEADALPLTFTAVYQLLPDGPVRPFVGAGPALLIATATRITNPILGPSLERLEHREQALGGALRIVVRVREREANAVSHVMAQPQVEEPYALEERVELPLAADAGDRLQAIERDRTDRLAVTTGNELRHADRDSPWNVPAVDEPDDLHLCRPGHGATERRGHAR